MAQEGQYTTATKSNKKSTPLRFWYLQMLSKHQGNLYDLILDLGKEPGVNVDDEFGAIATALESLKKKIQNTFPDPRVS